MRVAVIGGGPAGSETARRLAGGGIETILFDPTFDREKACGGGVPWKGHRDFLRDTAEPVPASEVREVLFESPSGHQVAVPLPEPLHIYSRRVLDRAWAHRAERAGARLRAEKVVAVAPSDPRASGSFVVRTGSGHEEPFDAIVGADGVNSLVRRTVGAPFDSADLSQAVGVFVPGRSGETARLAFVEGLDGYLWSFPRTDHLAVGACAPLRAGTAATLWTHLAAYLGRIVPGARSRELPSYSALIPSLSPSGFAANRMAGPGWCLVGDAAGTVDPLTREGIAWGLRSAATAAASLLDRTPAAYPARWEREHGRELRWAAERRDRFYAPEMTERLVQTLGASRAVRRIMADLLLGRQPYLTLKRRLVAAAFPGAVRWFLRRVFG